MYFLALVYIEEKNIITIILLLVTFKLFFALNDKTYIWVLKDVTSKKIKKKKMLITQKKRNSNSSLLYSIYSFNTYIQFINILSGNIQDIHWKRLVVPFTLLRKPINTRKREYQKS